MKKKIISISALCLLLIMAVVGCTIDEPGYVIIDDSTPPNVTLTDDSKTQVVDDEGDIIAIDPITNSLVTLTYSHFEVHEGCSYKCDVADTTLGIGDTLVLAFRTPPNEKLAHMFTEYQTLVGGELAFYENPTWDNQSGTLNPIINRKREPPLDSSVLLEDQGQAEFVASQNMILSPTGLDLAGEDQILLHHFYAFGEKVKENAGGSAADVDEFVLRNDTQYALVFTSTAADNKAWISLKWYEHEDGGD